MPFDGGANETVMEHTIPVIDVAKLTQGGIVPEGLIREIDRACRDVGFFSVINHGVDQKLIADVFVQMAAFFDCSDEVKEKVAIRKSAHMRGYFSEGADMSDGILGDIKEGFDMASDLPLDDKLVKANLTFYGPNAWPENMPDFKAVMTDYHSQMLAFGMNLLKVFALALKMPPHYFDDKFKKPMAQLRVLRYPSTDYTRGEPIGAGEHTDFGWLTMIAESDAGGLEIQSSGGSWIKVKPIPNAFVVNVGDLMSRWTNDRYKATMHRVINSSGKLRHSAAFFMDPDYMASVECLPSCCSDESPARYEKILAGDYMDKRFLETTTFRELEISQEYELF